MDFRLPGRPANRSPGPRRRNRTRRLAAAVATLAVLAGATGVWAGLASATEPPVRHTARTLPINGVRIDTTYYTAGDPDSRRPAVLLAHGFGGSKDDVRPQAERLARSGYAVLTWSARGFGDSTGRIGLNDPKAEVADVSRLIDWLSHRPEVLLDHRGDPRVGVTGVSYGGAVSLLAAGHDDRVDAIAPQLTYWNLADALFPGGVYKKLWTGIFFTTGSAGTLDPGSSAGTQLPPGGTDQDGAAPGNDPQLQEGTDAKNAARSEQGRNAGNPAPSQGSRTRGDDTSEAVCGRFERRLCAMYQRVAVNGRPDAAARALLEERSPSAVGTRIKVPTLIAQGQSDSLFPLGQADAMAQRIRANGAPVAVDWVSGGHDGGDPETDRMTGRVMDWFDRYLKRDTSVDIGPVFRVSRTGGTDSTDGSAKLHGASADRYPGLAGHPRTVPLERAGTRQTFTNPPGGGPPAISAVPGLGGPAGRLSNLGAGLSRDLPGQFARFDSAPLDRDLQITGAPSVTVHLTSSRAEAVLFGKVYDVSPDGARRVLPGQLVAPLRVTGAQQGKDVRITLPAVDHEVQEGHRLSLVLASTDLGYASPAAPATYTASVRGEGLTVPTAPALGTAAVPVPAWVWWLPGAGAVVALALVLTGRRRTATPPPDPTLAGTPLQITGLSKRYARSADAYAVRDLSFRAERGQVLGLLGPNGAGKTTTLRMLMGLITPDAGEIRVFGHAVRPGAPVLSRVGSFVEGAGFLPHLSGRANLELYWRATGRPPEDAHVDEALRIAGLGGALERPVRTYSQGMRQRLAIAQAMLGLPDLLILDEPTNGLDPPQIREMRNVMIRYAEGGRTVIVSSHLLAEVEQTCTHLVVMDRGRLVQAGAVAEIVGAGHTLLVGLAEELPERLFEKVTALPYVAEAVRVPGGLVVRLATDPAEPAGGPDGAARPAGPDPGAARLLTELVRLGVPVESMGPHRRLEDAFLTMIGGSA